MFFIKLALTEVTVGSEVKWGPWSASNNLFRKLFIFLLNFGMFYSRTKL